MFKFVILPICLIVAPVHAETASDDIPFEWLRANAPYGFDLTSDGNIWVNLNAVGRKDDYAILASDLMERKDWGVSAWIRGYHLRNPSVKYRVTKTKVNFDCQRRMYQRADWVAYSASGEVIDSDNERRDAQEIVPGSVAENWIKVICKTT